MMSFDVARFKTHTRWPGVKPFERGNPVNLLLLFTQAGRSGSSSDSLNWDLSIRPNNLRGADSASVADPFDAQLFMKMFKNIVQIVTEWQGVGFALL